MTVPQRVGVIPGAGVVARFDDAVLVVLGSEAGDNLIAAFERYGQAQKSSAAIRRLALDIFSCVADGQDELNFALAVFQSDSTIVILGGDAVAHVTVDGTVRTMASVGSSPGPRALWRDI